LTNEGQAGVYVSFIPGWELQRAQKTIISGNHFFRALENIK
jgi:hypothetical protein